MPVGKSQLLEEAAFVLASVADDINNVNTPDTSITTVSNNPKHPLGSFLHKITVNGAPYLVIVVPDAQPDVPLNPAHTA